LKRRTTGAAAQDDGTPQDWNAGRRSTTQHDETRRSTTKGEKGEKVLR